MTRTAAEDLDEFPPENDFVTDYDRRHLKLYARLLDAESDGAPLVEIARILFGIDAGREPERARKIHEGHLGRARWMAENGYRSLLAQNAT